MDDGETYSATSMSETKEEIRIDLARRMILIPSAGFIVGTAIGMTRGGRDASLRFLAEHVHHPPRTVEGWYFYKKTKNYRVMWGALKGGGVGGLKTGLVSLGYVGLEEGIGRIAPGWKEIGAGAGTGALFSVIYRLPLNVARRTLFAGLVIGSAIKALDALKSI